MSLLSSLLALLATISDPNVLQHSTTLNPSYVLESSTLLNGKIPVKKYTTTKTGIKIVIANTDGPLVNGYFCLATRTHDDNGLPHCLEHLVFFGSEDYPYKGALLQIASRCYSAATNAFTAVDRTCYTSSHVGKNGYLALLPVYLDHILYPTLDPSTYITEVHHVNGDGIDGGVVYSEMEAISYNTNWYSMIKTLYGDYGYSSFFGGRVKNLRQNTTLQMNVDYHKQFYRPENLCITVCGNITIDDVMSSVKKIEAKISKKPKRPKISRPWKAPVPPLKTTVVKTLVPKSNEGFAEIYIAWRGPNCVTEYRKFLACTTLVSHLNNIAVSEYATYVYGDTYQSAKTALYFTFTDVPVEKVDLVFGKFHDWLKNITCGIEKLDMNAIHDIIQNKMSSFSSQLETDPYNTISNIIANDFVYGSTSSDFKMVLNNEKQYKYLLTVPETYWINLLNEYFINKKYAQSIGIFSQAEIDRLNKEEAEEFKTRIETLGPAGLEKKANELAAAIAENSKLVPDSVVNSIPVPSTGNIHYLDVKAYRSDDSNEGMPKGLDLNSWPSYAEVYDCRTNYIYITATFFTNNIATNLRPYLYLLLKLINEVTIEHDDPKVTDLNSFATLNTDYRIGLTKNWKTFSCGQFSQTAAFTIQVQKTEYENGVKYLIADLQYTLFDVDTVKNIVATLWSYVSGSMGDPENAVFDLLRTMYYKSDTNVKTYSMMYQKKFLTSLLAKLNDEATAQSVIDDLNNLRSELISSKNLAVHVTADFTALALNNTDFNSPWQLFDFSRGPKKLNAVFDWEVMVAPDTVSTQGEVIGLNITDTAFLVHTSPAVSDLNSEDLPPLLVALTYLTQREGPMWNRVRGPGYAYMCFMSLIPAEGVIQYQLYKASDILRGFDESVKIINELTGPNARWSQTLLDSAKSATTYQVVNRVPTLGDVQLQSILLSFQKVSPDYNKNLVPKIAAVTVDDVNRVAQLYLTKMFSTTKSKTAIVCNDDEANGIANGLKKHGFNLPVRQSWEDSLLAQF